MITPNEIVTEIRAACRGAGGRGEAWYLKRYIAAITDPEHHNSRHRLWWCRRAGLIRSDCPGLGCSHEHCSEGPTKLGLEVVELLQGADG